jgi:hypothetical protein
MSSIIDDTDIEKKCHMKIRFAVKYAIDTGFKIITYLVMGTSTGKTYTTLKTVMAEKIQFVYLAPTHNLVDNKLEDVGIGLDITHLEGMKRLCPRKNDYEQAIKWNINPKTFLCGDEDKCPAVCPYQAQFKGIFDKSWAGVHSHLGFLNSVIKDPELDYNPKVLIIDEDFTNAITHSASFTTVQLKNLKKILSQVIANTANKDLIKKEKGKLIKRKKSGKGKKADDFFISFYLQVTALANALISILDDENITENLQNIDFVDMITEKLDNDIYMTKNPNFACISLREKYYDFLYKNLDLKKQTGDGVTIEKKTIPRNFKNIFDDIIKIFEIYTKYKYVKKNQVIPMGVNIYSRRKNEIWVKTIDPEIPDIPIICIKAFGDPKKLQNMVNRTVDVIDFDIEEKYNIIQIVDGNYSLKSMGNASTRNRLYNFLVKHIKECIEKGTKKVWMITHKPYSTIENEVNKSDADIPINTKNQSLEYAVLNAGIPPEKFGITYHQVAVGVELDGLDDEIIIVGVSEPNPKTFANELSVFHEGEEPLSNERIVEPRRSKHYGHDFRYKDTRYFDGVKGVREYNIKQGLGRLRGLFQKGKNCLFIANLDIGVPAWRMTMKEYEKMHGWTKESANLKVLKLINKGIGISRKDLVIKIRRWATVKNFDSRSKLGYEVVIDNLLKNNMIKCSEIEQKFNVKTVYQATKKGREYLEKL